MTAVLAWVTVEAIATHVQVLPEVIDISLIPTGAGLGSLGFVAFGAARRFEPERLGRLSLTGTLLGGLGTALCLVLFLVADVLF